MEFAVKIKETLERTVIIEAEDKYQALEIVVLSGILSGSKPCHIQTN